MTMLNALLTGSIPDSIRSRLPRVQHGTFPQDLEVDAHGYPSEEAVAAITMVAAQDARRWLHDVFPKLWEEELNTSGRIRVEDTKDAYDEPVLRVTVATGGWSGCEDVIDAVLGHFVMRRYLYSTTTGGQYTFIIPHED